MSRFLQSLCSAQTAPMTPRRLSSSLSWYSSAVCPSTGPTSPLANGRK
ncbi:MAG TPA: hypothetical protein PK025_05230 [Spirochaetales bacterium]|nr:hypothetical protein [Spirochaetales bacterium]